MWSTIKTAMCVASAAVCVYLTTCLKNPDAISASIESVVSVYSLPVELVDDMTFQAGAGFFITPNLIATSYHVVKDAGAIRIATYNGNHFPAKMHGYDRIADFALLKIERNYGTPISLRTSTLKVGEEIRVIGHPKGLSYSVSRGIVSHTGRSADKRHLIHLVQVDAAINQGSSGGAVIDKDGQLVGIVQSIVSDTSSFAGIGLIYKSVDMLESIKLIRKSDDMVAERPIIDATLEDNVTCGTYKVKGVGVREVQEASLAYKSGLRTNDVITRIGPVTINRVYDANKYISEQDVDDTVPLAIFECSDGSIKVINLKLSSLK